MNVDLDDRGFARMMRERRGEQLDSEFVFEGWGALWYLAGPVNVSRRKVEAVTRALETGAVRVPDWVLVHGASVVLAWAVRGSESVLASVRVSEAGVEVFRDIDVNNYDPPLWSRGTPRASGLDSREWRPIARMVLQLLGGQ